MAHYTLNNKPAKFEGIAKSILFLAIAITPILLVDQMHYAYAYMLTATGIFGLKFYNTYYHNIPMWLIFWLSIWLDSSLYQQIGRIIIWIYAYDFILDSYKLNEKTWIKIIFTGIYTYLGIYTFI